MVFLKDDSSESDARGAHAFNAESKALHPDLIALFLLNSIGPASSSMQRCQHRIYSGLGGSAKEVPIAGEVDVALLGTQDAGLDRHIYGKRDCMTRA